ncbi:MAG: nucleotide exchange factor GrpE [Prevotellaceae bacterium]|jgi:molecular chaperone GrpE|nr:nucleotide exchange factor GrpE [Prevotellaceae bacterium]
MEENRQNYQEQEEITTDANPPANETAEQLAELQDKYLRLSAEFDNYRKRTLRERIELVKTAGEDMLKDMLPVLDDFDRAIHTLNASASLDALAEGTKLIHHKMKSIMESRGLKEICPEGQDFDPDLHEAIAKIPAEDKAGKIVDVVQKGYSLNDKIIRHPKVVVGE